MQFECHAIYQSFYFQCNYHIVKGINVIQHAINMVLIILCTFSSYIHDAYAFQHVCEIDHVDIIKLVLFREKNMND